MNNIFKTMPIHEVFMYQLTISNNVELYKQMLKDSPQDRVIQAHLERNTQLLKWCDELLREEEALIDEAMGLHQTM